MPDHAALTWDGTGTRFYEMGVEKGVLYPMGANGYESGVAWNGLTSVTESPDGAELTDLYADNIKYASMRSAETFGGTIEAYTYPEAFAECDGSATPVTGAYVGQQARKAFGLCYKTLQGNDTTSEGMYKLHIVYGCTAAPSEKAYETVNDSPDAITFSWEFKTTPVAFTTEAYASLKPTSLIVIDSAKADLTKLAALEAMLYGSSSADAALPTPDQVLATLA